MRPLGLIGLVALLFTSELRADLSASGDLVAGGTLSCVILCPPCFGGYLQIRGGDALLKDDLDTRSWCAPADAVMAGDDVLVADASKIKRLARDGTISTFATGFGPSASSLAIDEFGTLFVASFQPKIFKYDVTGRPLGSVSLPAGAVPVSIDLAADQCTLDYVSASKLKRFDLCTNASLADIDAAVSLRRIRLLPDGTILATTLDSEVIRIDSSGAILQNFGTGSVLAVNRSSTAFWTVIPIAGAYGQISESRLIEVDLGTGATLIGPVTMVSPQYFGTPIVPSLLLVVGERRVSQAATSIPAVLPLMLFALVFALGVVGVLRLRS